MRRAEFKNHSLPSSSVVFPTPNRLVIVVLMTLTPSTCSSRTLHNAYREDSADAAERRATLKKLDAAVAVVYETSRTGKEAIAAMQALVEKLPPTTTTTRSGELRAIQNKTTFLGSQLMASFEVFRGVVEHDGKQVRMAFGRFWLAAVFRRK